jgi:catechol 2,3-dioxygenase-like lactoylglutathione lyase family enzyme
VARGLDHIAHAVRDLDAAAALYRRMGFTVGARNRHPWGTHNHVVQLPGFFVELLTVAEPEKLIGGGFAELFGRFNQNFLREREGLSFLVLESTDAAADHCAFEAAGIAASDTLRFEREGKRPDGTPVTVAFSLAFARDTLAPGTSFAVCQQHYPENFWNPDFQKHANGAIGIAGAVMVAENPTDHHIFLSAFAGERALQSTSSGITVATPRGDIQIMSAAAFEDHFSDRAPDAGSGARLAALRLRVRQLPVAASALQASDIGFAERIGRIVVPADTAMGATIVFEPA